MNAPASVHRLARATALAAFVLILAGASVTSTRSGLAVPDWPLSYGQWLPPMQGGVFFEHGHRLIAASVGFLVWCLAALAWIKRSGPWVRRLTLLAAGAVLLQGVLGGITVLYGLAKPVSVAHACLAQALFTLLVFLAVATGESSAETPAEDRESAGKLAWHAGAAAGAVYLQLILGAAYRHGLAPFAPHLAGALLASALVFTAAFRGWAGFSRGSGLILVSGALAVALLAQLFLGLIAFMAGSAAPTWGSAAAATFHVGGGALILALSVTLAAKAHRASAPAAGTA